MYQHVYISSEVFAFSNTELVKMLEKCRLRNGDCQVTGLLLYLSGNFIQLLEGEEEDVLATFARIKVDPRHRGINTLFTGGCEQRDFQEWSMGFETLNAETGAKIPGYSDFLSTDTTPLTRNSAALGLLEFFKKMAQ